MDEGGLGRLGSIVVMLVSTVLFVLLCEFVSMRIGRLSTRAIPPRQPVSFVSLRARTNNKCELLRTHNRNNVSCMRPTSIEGAPPDL
jgi:hypothetical protein